LPRLSVSVEIESGEMPCLAFISLYVSLYDDSVALDEGENILKQHRILRKTNILKYKKFTLKGKRLCVLYVSF
jgi:hypothetical protein